MIDEELRTQLRRLWESACQDKPVRPSCQVIDDLFVFTINGNRDNWAMLVAACGVPGHADQYEDGDTLTCTWVSHADRIFGEGGMMAARFPDYEVRAPQLHMARLVQRAIETNDTAVIEAGTGTGKSFAYAAICMAMGKKVVISTSNKALQAQLYHKDLPFLASLFPGKRYALALGKSNYACRQKVEGEDGALFADEEAIEDPQLREWYYTTSTGNTEEIRFPVERADLAKITVDEDCTGKHCPLYSTCHYYRARAERFSADVVVCNHALLAQHQAFGYLLPEWEVLVIDEAHNIAADIRKAVGAELAVSAMHTAIKLVAPYVASETLQYANALVDQFAVEAFADVVVTEDNRQHPAPEGEEYPAGNKLNLALLDLAEMVWDEYEEPIDQQDAMQAKRAERVRSVSHRLNAFLGGEVVRWLETGRDRQAIIAMPHYVGDYISVMVGDKPAIFTSATLATPTLRPLLDTIGMDDTLQMIAQSPFDYQHNSLIYVPRSSEPNPRDDGYNRFLADQLSALVAASKGGALLLFTSNKQMNDMYTALAFTFRQGLKLNVLKQGGGVGRQEITRQFKTDGNAVLFATRSFFEGVSIEGSALRLVVLDKLPFEAPSELGKAIERAAGAYAFERVRLPDMLIVLKQAVGRLIRTTTDRGVIAVLDSRIRSQWAARVFESLPPAPSTASLGDVVTFYAPAKRTPVAVQAGIFESAREVA